jgi:hypothetical protein
MNGGLPRCNNFALEAILSLSRKSVGSQVGVNMAHPSSGDRSIFGRMHRHAVAPSLWANFASSSGNRTMPS